MVKVAIVDYGMGNLHSVQQACHLVGLGSVITADPTEVETAPAVILPGIGGMPDAMAMLRSVGLDQALRAVVASGRPLLGICLGMQLLMRTGSEFREHAGLDIVPGTVARFPTLVEDGRALKIPAIGWNSISPASGKAHQTDWSGTVLEGVRTGEPFYFVHSYYVLPDDPSAVLATTRYGELEYCSALAYRQVFGCQFHPERSGRRGLLIYRNFARLIAGEQRR